MAGIFDFLSGTGSTVPMTPQQAQAMELYRAGQAAVTSAAPTSTWMPPQEALRGPQAALGVDPVAVQQQSGTRAAQAAKTFYANAAGDVGTQIPKGAATAGEYAADAAGAASKGAGIFGTVAKVAGGAASTGIQAALYSPDAGAGSELTPAQREAKNPGEQADAQKYAQHIQELTRQSAGGLSADPVQAQAAQALSDQTQPPVVDTPAGEATQANPVTVQQAAAKTHQDTEIKRQTLEQGALKGLSTGAVSRPKFAEAVVEADLARSGQQVTPEAKQRAVTAELTNMKSMDNGDLSKYISYALIAGGVLAVLFDKSGRAAAGFNQGFNKQLDRNVTMGIQNQKNAAAQAKLNQELLIQGEKFKRDDRGLDIKATTVKNQGLYQQGQLSLGEGKLSLAQQSEGRQASQGAAGLGLRAQGLTIQQQKMAEDAKYNDLNYQLAQKRVAQGDTANAIKAAKVAQGPKAAPGVALTEKGSAKVASDFVSQQGLNMDSGAKSAFASQLQQASKNDPRWATNPAQVAAEILQKGGYESTPNPGIPFIPFTGGGNKIRQKKY